MPDRKRAKGFVTYKQSGVNVVTGDSASQILYDAARKTWPNRKHLLGEIRSFQQGFRSTRCFDIKSIPKGLCLGMNFDGIGTKIELAERLGRYDTLAFDLLAMICDDAAIQGAEPLHVGSIIDVAQLDLGIIRDLASGLIQAAKAARVAVINGELAELPGRIGGYGSNALNWGGCCLWAARSSKLTARRLPRAGDVVIGVHEQGFRSNGYSLLRSIFATSFGSDWGTKSGTGRNLVEYAARPSLLYTPYILSLTGGVSGVRTKGVKSFVHVTGGGIIGRLRYLCSSLKVGVRIDNPIAPPKDMIEIIQLGRVKLTEAYRTWNMGTGLLVIGGREIEDTAISKATFHGFSAQRIGYLTEKAELKLNLCDGTNHTEQVK